MAEPMIRPAFLALVSGAHAVVSSAPSFAQAWLPPQGEASLSVGYGDVFGQTQRVPERGNDDGLPEAHAGRAGAGARNKQ